jgi:hypothetical protein
MGLRLSRPACLPAPVPCASSPEERVKAGAGDPRCQATLPDMLLHHHLWLKRRRATSRCSARPPGPSGSKTSWSASMPQCTHRHRAPCSLPSPLDTPAEDSGDSGRLWAPLRTCHGTSPHSGCEARPWYANRQWGTAHRQRVGQRPSPSAAWPYAGRCSWPRLTIIARPDRSLGALTSEHFAMVPPPPHP